MRLVGIELHTRHKGLSGYCYHCRVLGVIFRGCIDVIPRKKGNFGVKQVLDISLVEATR